MFHWKPNCRESISSNFGHDQPKKQRFLTFESSTKWKSFSTHHVGFGVEVEVVDEFERSSGFSGRRRGGSRVFAGGSRVAAARGFARASTAAHAQTFIHVGRGVSHRGAVVRAARCTPKIAKEKVQHVSLPNVAPMHKIFHQCVTRRVCHLEQNVDAECWICTWAENDAKCGGPFVKLALGCPRIFVIKNHMYLSGRSMHVIEATDPGAFLPKLCECQVTKGHRYE